MNLLRRLGYLEAAQRRKEKAAGRSNDSHISPTVKAFLHRLRGDTLGEDDITVPQDEPKRNHEGVSETVIRFLEALHGKNAV